MSEPYLGEIRMFGGNFAPVGYVFCDGSNLPIAEYDALFNLIGTTYGGDGMTTFAVPNLCSRVPMHNGTGPSSGSAVIGEMGGVESVTLTTAQLPAHTHSPLAATGAATTDSPSGTVWAPWPDSPYSNVAPTAQLAPSAIGATGGSQPHENLSPYLAVNFIIAVYGVYPTQS